MVKLNIGCGFDYRDGFINIDGSDRIPKVDMIIDFDSHSILEYFAEGEVDFILANDFIEHHFHFRAIEILRDFFVVLKPGGTLQMRLPEIEGLLRLLAHRPPDEKPILLYGGQDIPQGKGDEESRKAYPQFYCHKYAYTQNTMKRELERLGFVNITTCLGYDNTNKVHTPFADRFRKFDLAKAQERSNFVVTAQKPGQA